MGRWSPHRTATAVAVTLLATVASMIPTPSVAGAATWTRDDAFVTAATHDFLGRGPTGAELTAATSSSLRTTAARARVVAGLSNSTEWISVTVQGFYQDTLGRPADADGREYWVGLIKSGKLSVASVAASFYASSEYFEHLGGGTPASWVSDLYTKLLGRSEDSAGGSYWVDRTAGVGRERVAFAFYQSQESRRDRVAHLYEKLLRREPDAAGWSTWASFVAVHGDLSLAASLAASAEYDARAWARYPSDPHSVPTQWHTLESPVGPLGWTPKGVTDAGLTYGSTEDGRAIVCASPCTSPTVLAAPVGSDAVTAVGATSTGEIVGNSGTWHEMRGVVWSSSASTPVVVPQTTGVVTRAIVSGVSSGGEIFGIGYDRLDLGQHPLVWTSAGADPTILASPASSSAVPQVRAISSSGEIVGTSDASGFGGVGVVWASPTATPTVLTGPGGGFDQVSATGVDDAGEIVGGAYNPRTRQTKALVWASASASPTVVDASSASSPITLSGITAAGTIYGTGAADALVWPSSASSPTVLQAPSGDNSMWTVGVSSSGEVVGVGSNSVNESEGLVWASASSAPVRLTPASGPAGVTVAAVSSSGEVVGSGSVGSVNQGEGIVWATATSSPNVLAAPAGIDNVQATGVSRDGEIVGTGSRGFTNASEGLVWATPSATPTVLAAPPGATEVHEVHVSANGLIVGVATDPVQQIDHVVVWTSPSAAPTVLTSPTGVLWLYARGVSSSGQVAGSGFVWPTPTSASVATRLAAPSDGHSGVVVNGISPSGVVFGIGVTGLDREGLLWATPTAAPTALSAPSDGASVDSIAGTSADGVIAGTAKVSSTTEGLIWLSPSQPPTVLTEPSGIAGASLSAISATGIVAGQGMGAAGASVGFVLTR